MHFLFLNWKDLRHPESGGAEIATHQFAKNLVKLGHTATLFTAQPDHLKSEEIIEGVKIIRQGNRATVYFQAFLYYRKHLAELDLVIDQIHGLPFFTPLYVKKPILVWIHEVAGGIWFYEWPFFVGLLGCLIEKWYFRFYKTVSFITDAQSTKAELISHGILANKISVSPLTIDKPDVKHAKKSSTPLLIYVGRLSPMKRLPLLLHAVYILKKTHPSLKLLIVGDGKKQEVKRLREMTKNLILEDQVEFLGKVPEVEKFELLAKSWLHVHPSIKEGFGLTVLEAASQATPTVCFDVPGLCDVVNAWNGILVKKQTASALSKAIQNLFMDKKKLSSLSRTCLNWFLKLPGWKEQTRKFEKLLNGIYKSA